MGNCSIVRLFDCSIVAMALVVSSFAADTAQTRVNITSQPSGATVVIDGMDRGTTPVTLFDLAPGRHHLKYRLPDTSRGTVSSIYRMHRGLTLRRTRCSRRKGDFFS